VLKSSDFVIHDINPKTVFEGCNDLDRCEIPYELEMVLKKWYHVERSREFRCFVRNRQFIAISQRDMNYYDFLVDEETQKTIKQTISRFWTSRIREEWPTVSYVFDIVLTRDLLRCHLIDFNPYHPKTDPLLFSYEELSNISFVQGTLPYLQVINSAGDPRVNRGAPTHYHNMVPYDILQLEGERDADDWIRALQSTLL